MQTMATRGASRDHLLVKSITPVGGQAIEVGTITALVGPNNAGKSESLRDLLRLAANVELAGERPGSGEEVETKLIHDLHFIPKLTIDRMARGLTSLTEAGGEGLVLQGVGPDLKSPHRHSVASEIKNILYRPVLTARSVRMTSLGELMPMRVAYLSPDSHKELLAPTMACSPTKAPENLLQTLLYAPPPIHEALDAAFTLAFPGLHVRLDATERIHLCLRVGSEFPELSDDPIEAVRQYAGLRRADQEGDGCRSYLAVILGMLLGQGRIILLDQPDAYLHPEQARCLGRWISQNAARLGCQVFVSTHGSALLNGLLEGETDMIILRLQRTATAISAHAVPADVSNALAHSPLLAYQNTIECLLRDGVIVVPETEDRVIYETVAKRILEAPNLSFVHTHGSRNLGVVTSILRRAGIPTCVVTQLDALRTEAGFCELVQAATGQDPPSPWLATRERLARHVEGMFNQRELSAGAHEVESFLEEFKTGNRKNGLGTQPTPLAVDSNSKWARLQRKHLSSLPHEVRVWVEELLDDLKQKGIFVSPKGGFQGWIPVDVAGNDKEIWLAKAVQSLHRGECPADLRAFVSDIVAHARALTLPTRAARARPRA
ncbi:MAG: AAA family ATPase [Pirellulaceae bacterium]